MFDCSARLKGSSLNDQLLSGPDLTNNLLGVLCRFRMYHYAITCDVEKMFHQFIVPKNDRNYLRFLWWSNGDTELQPHNSWILQEVCQKGVSWDSPLPDELRPRWEQWKADLLKLQNLRIPRCFIPKTMGKRRSYVPLLYISKSWMTWQQMRSLKCHCDENSHFFFALFFTQNNLPSCTMSFCPERKN